MVASTLGPLLVLSAATVLAACRDTGDDPAEGSDALSGREGVNDTGVVDLVGPIGPVAREDPFFPTAAEVMTFSNGLRSPKPYRAYDMDYTAIVGVADVAPFAEIAQAGGFAPVRTVVDGQERAFVRITIQRYRDHELPAYTELGVLFDAVPASSAAATRPVPWVNTFTPLVPSATLRDHLYVVAEDATSTATGRLINQEALGLPTAVSGIQLRLEKELVRFSVTDTVTASPRFDTGLGAKLAFGAGFAQALGIDMLSLPLGAPSTAVRFANPDVRAPGAWVQTHSRVKASATVNAWTDADDPIVFGHSPAAKLLKDAHFTPKLKIREPHMKWLIETIDPDPCAVGTMTCTESGGGG